MLRIFALMMMLSLFACTNTQMPAFTPIKPQQDKAFGEALNKNLEAQKIKNTHAKDAKGEVTSQELTPSYEAYQRGKSVQSSSGEKLSAPMSAGNAE